MIRPGTQIHDIYHFERSAWQRSAEVIKVDQEIEVATEFAAEQALGATSLRQVETVAQKNQRVIRENTRTGHPYADNNNYIGVKI